LDTTEAVQSAVAGPWNCSIAVPLLRLRDACSCLHWNLAIWQCFAFKGRIRSWILNRRRVAFKFACPPRLRLHHINLVDPASSHMLVSKIKPCMSQYKLLHGETANGSLKQLSFIWLLFIIWITMVILKLIHAPRPDSVEGLCLLDTEPT
jgi:hypothetical protein